MNSALRHGIGIVAALLLAGCSSITLTPSTSTPSGQHSPVYLENQQPGTTEWEITHRANGSIAGYPSSLTVVRGGSIDLMVSTTSASYTLQVFRIGWYQGKGGRAMTSAATLEAQNQPAPLTDPSTGLLECNWSSSYKLDIPSSWISGFYVVKLTTTDTQEQRYIPFIVTDPSSHSDLLFNVPVFTYEAYNNWGGKSLYGFNSTDAKAAVKVSLHRPFSDDAGSGELITYDIDSIRFLEKHGYDVSYSTDLDLHSQSLNLGNHKAFVEFGKPEYWSRPMRTAVSNARDAGLNLGFFSGNEMFWQIRLEDSALTGNPNATLVCYRSAVLDPDATNPSTAGLTTVQWQQAPVNDPEDLLLGAAYLGALADPGDMVITDASSWVFAGAGLANGAHIANLIGGEVDSYKPKGPSGVTVLAQSPVIVTTNSGDRAADAEMTIYTAQSGAVVVDAGTLRWGWGLEPYARMHNLGSASSDAAVQQITQNILARFGAAPES